MTALRCAAGVALRTDGLAVVTACGGERSREAEVARPPLVEAVEARVGALPVEESLPGVVRAANQVAIRPEASA